MESPSCCEGNFVIRNSPRWTERGAWRTPIWIWRLVPLMRPGTFKIRKIMKWKRSSGRSSPIQSLAQWAELNRLSGIAMKYAMDRLCPGRPKPRSYFSLVQQFLDVVPRIEALKRSACTEGARLALARVKTYWADMEPTVVASRDSDKAECL